MLRHRDKTNHVIGRQHRDSSVGSSDVSLFFNWDLALAPAKPG